MHIKIVSLTPHGACSFYRTMGAFSFIAGLHITLIKEISWLTIADADIVYFERPFSQNFVEGAQIVKACNKILWVDLDDDLWEVPKYNPAHKFYSDKKNQRFCELVLSMSDLVTTTTPKLAEVVAKFANRVEVIPNGFNDYLFKMEKDASSFPVITWRGSNTHRGDLLQYGASIRKIAEKFPEWSWRFIGGEPWYIVEAIANSLSFPEMDIIDYFKFMRESKPSIHIVPLVFNPFNVSKSNISYIEGTYAGAAVLAPDMPEWRRPGVTLYKNEQDFADCLQDLIENEWKRAKCYKEAVNYVKKECSLSKFNDLRKSFLNEYVKGGARV